MTRRKTCPMCRRSRRLAPDGLCGACSYEVGTIDESPSRDFADARYRAEVAARTAILGEAKRKAGKQGLTLRQLDELLSKR